MQLIHLRTMMGKSRSDGQSQSHFAGRDRILMLWPACLAFMLLFICAGQVAAMTDPCQSILDQISSLRKQEQAEKDDFRGGPRDKPLAAEIRKVEDKYRPLIAAKEHDYDQCRVAHGGKLDESVTFTGTATMTTTNTNAPGPFVSALTIGVKFLKYDHTKLEITNFPTITVGPFPIKIGQTTLTNTTTITLASVQSATANPSTGKLTLNMTLHFKHSLTVAGDSDLPITVSTDNSGGSRINTGTRNLKLAGTGTFVGGFLGGSTGTLIIDGTLSALP